MAMISATTPGRSRDVGQGPKGNPRGPCGPPGGPANWPPAAACGPVGRGPPPRGRGGGAASSGGRGGRHVASIGSGLASLRGRDREFAGRPVAPGKSPRRRARAPAGPAARISGPGLQPAAGCRMAVRTEHARRPLGSKGSEGGPPGCQRPGDLPRALCVPSPDQQQGPARLGAPEQMDQPSRPWLWPLLIWRSGRAAAPAPPGLAHGQQGFPGRRHPASSPAASRRLDVPRAGPPSSGWPAPAQNGRQAPCSGRGSERGPPASSSRPRSSSSSMSCRPPSARRDRVRVFCPGPRWPAPAARSWPAMCPANSPARMSAPTAGNRTSARITCPGAQPRDSATAAPRWVTPGRNRPATPGGRNQGHGASRWVMTEGPNLAPVVGLPRPPGGTGAGGRGPAGRRRRKPSWSGCVVDRLERPPGRGRVSTARPRREPELPDTVGVADPPEHLVARGAKAARGQVRPRA